MSLTMFDFENADIGRLAIHLGGKYGHRAAEALPFLVTTTSESLFVGKGLLVGVNVVETTGSAVAAVDFLDGADAGGTLLVPYTLTANQSARDQWNDHPPTILRGVFASVLSGSVRGTVFVVRHP